mmetsp:Transcript_1294/g.2113  ORF Transcript_1294/g.2113 Transcript_1294/m.2113 type:complete len:200 (+) Transcript_1294:91-690(+)
MRSSITDDTAHRHQTRQQQQDDDCGILPESSPGRLIHSFKQAPRLTLTNELMEVCRSVFLCRSTKHVTVRGGRPTLVSPTVSTTIQVVYKLECYIGGGGLEKKPESGFARAPLLLTTLPGLIVGGVVVVVVGTAVFLTVGTFFLTAPPPPRPILILVVLMDDVALYFGRTTGGAVARIVDDCSCDDDDHIWFLALSTAP